MLHHPSPPAGALSSPDPLANTRRSGTSWPPNSLVRAEPEEAGGTCSTKKKGLSAQQSTLGSLPSASSLTACAQNQVLRGKRLSVLNKPLNVGTRDKGSLNQVRQRATFSFLAFSILALSSGIGTAASSRELGPLSVPPQVSEAEMTPGFSRSRVTPARVSRRTQSPFGCFLTGGSVTLSSFSLFLASQ